MDILSLISFYLRDLSLLASLFFFFATAKRKNAFSFRLTVTLTVYFIAITAIYFLNKLFFKPSAVWFLSSTTLFYFADYICLLIVPLFIFDTSPQEYFSRSIANQSTNMLLDIMMQLIYTPSYALISLMFANNASFAYSTTKSILSVAIIALLFLFLIKKWRPQNNTMIKNERITIACYSSVLFILYWLNIIASYIKSYVQGSLGYTGYIVLFFVCVFVLLLLYCIQSINEQKAETQVIEQLMHAREQQYAMAKANVDIINQKCHNLKHQINALKMVGEADRVEYIKELEKSIMLYGSVIATGNEIIDTILSEKTLYCENKGITLTTIIDAAPLKMMKTVDLYTLFGNAIDNAVEAVEACDEQNNRIISVHIFTTDALLAIQIRNFCDEKLIMENGLPATNKEDKNSHGFGLKSIQSIAKKYGGDVRISHENNIFTLFIGIPLP